MLRLTRFVGPLLVATAILAAGCSKPEDKFVGAYTGKVQLSQQLQDAIKKLPPQMQAQAQSQLGQISINLNLQKDKSFVLNLSAPGQTRSQSGTWSFSSQLITLSPKTATANGKPDTSPDAMSQSVLSPGADGKTLTVDPSRNPDLAKVGSITFTKSAS